MVSTMNKIALILFAAVSTVYTTTAFAESEGGPDMFRGIERFERDSIFSKRDAIRRFPAIESDDGIPYQCLPGRPCADTAAYYKEPKFHGEPVVAEDDY